LTLALVGGDSPIPSVWKFYDERKVFRSGVVSVELSAFSLCPVELMTTSYCLIRDSPNLEGQVPVFISPRNRVAQIYPRALDSFFGASTIEVF
jgi:hypothetical protein